MDPFDLDWRPTCPEFVSWDGGVALHVLAHHLESPSSIRRTARFVKARIRCFEKRTPRGWTHRLLLDNRGQHVPATQRERLRLELSHLKQIDHMGFLAESLP